MWSWWTRVHFIRPSFRYAKNSFTIRYKIALFSNLEIMLVRIKTILHGKMCGRPTLSKDLRSNRLIQMRWVVMGQAGSKLPQEGSFSQMLRTYRFDLHRFTPSMSLRDCDRGLCLWTVKAKIGVFDSFPFLFERSNNLCCEAFIRKSNFIILTCFDIISSRWG